MGATWTYDEYVLKKLLLGAICCWVMDHGSRVQPVLEAVWLPSYKGHTGKV